MKKIISALCVLTMLFVQAVPAFAVDADSTDVCEGNVTIVSCPADISSDTVSDIQESICAFVSDTDGNKHPVDCEVAISEVTLIAARSVAETEDESKTYAVKVAASTQKSTPNSGGYNINDISASATIIMIWTDRLGTDNSIDRLKGNLQVEKGTYTSSQIRWGSYHNQCRKTKTFSALNWDYAINYRPSQEGIMNLGSLHAEYQNWFSNGKSFSICVSPTHFD